MRKTTGNSTYYSTSRVISILRLTTTPNLALVCRDRSAGQSGPKSPFFNDDAAPENEDPHTLGNSMFDAEDFQGIYSPLSFVEIITRPMVGRLE